MAANDEAQRQGRYQRITGQDRGRLIDAFETTTQLVLQWLTLLKSNTQLRVVL